MASPLIKVEGVSKKYCKSLKRSMLYGIQDIAKNTLGKQLNTEDLRKDEFWALDDISFELKRGECLGLIGPNGSGKSTLLKVINGIITPDKGRIEVRGRIGALIEVGAGFHPMLTGRENIYINGTILGLQKKEIDKNFDEIVHFAEIEEFIDTPIKNYSTGMRVRLGFAIAAQMRPDVLLIDEVLAVGDMGFVIKCLNHIRRLMDHSAVILVSHQMQSIARFCTRIITLKNGNSICDTNKVSEGIDTYLGMFSNNKSFIGSGLVEIKDIYIQIDDINYYGKTKKIIIPPYKTIYLFFSLIITELIEAAEIKIFIESNDGRPIIVFPCIDESKILKNLKPGKYPLDINLGQIDLSPGRYTFAIAIMTPGGHTRLARISGTSPFIVTGDNLEWAPLRREVKIKINTDNMIREIK